VHPRYFDRQALTACWREALLAQSVLTHPGRGYDRHPQLERFKDQRDPVWAIAVYLRGIADEADSRGYRFDRTRIGKDQAGESAPDHEPEPSARAAHPLIPVTSGLVAYEWTHLTAKLAARSPDVAERWSHVVRPDVHPLFRTVPGEIAAWERVRH
jgi:hypothetical protein